MRRSPLVHPRRAGAGPVHGGARRDDRERRAARHPGGPGLLRPTACSGSISAYTLLFGGFLLLGGRAGDLLGPAPGVRRRAGAVRAAPRWSAGSRRRPGVLIAARAVQGLGGALLSPAALAILTVTFAHGRDRNIAMGIWGGLAGLGGTLGVVAGGLLVDALGWQWVFFVNVPIGDRAGRRHPGLRPREPRRHRRRARPSTPPARCSAPAGLLALVLGVIRAEPLGWGSAEVVGAARRRRASCWPPSLRSSRARRPRWCRCGCSARAALSTSSVALALNGAAFLAMFFLTAIFLQQVRGDCGARGRPAVPADGRRGDRRRGGRVAAGDPRRHPAGAVGGAVLSVAGLWLLAQAGRRPAATPPTPARPAALRRRHHRRRRAGQITAVADVAHDEAGAASGRGQRGYQVGGALGLAIITTLSTRTSTDALAGGAGQATRSSRASSAACWSRRSSPAINIVVALASPRLRPTAEQLAEAAAAA